jgi:hypothetical protein
MRGSAGFTIFVCVDRSSLAITVEGQMKVALGLERLPEAKMLPLARPETDDVQRVATWRSTLRATLRKPVRERPGNSSATRFQDIVQESSVGPFLTHRPDETAKAVDVRQIARHELLQE